MVRFIESWEGQATTPESKNGKKPVSGLKFGRPSRHNLEYDLGRVKKVKTAAADNKFRQKSNPFQSKQNEKNFTGEK